MADFDIQREFTFDTRDFDRVRQLIYARAGISLHSGKQAMVYSRLSRRLRDTGHQTFHDYLHWLETTSDARTEAEWQEFINALTTNLTSFFREEHHFHMLADAIRKSGKSQARIWCNATSTGEEPYSIVMTCTEAMGGLTGLKLLATDIDTKVLSTAARGVYSAESRGLSAERLKRFFLRGTGANSGSIRVRPEFQRPIEFRTFNLMSTSWQLGEPFDYIFCRNVMIYFDAPTQRKVLEGMHRVLKPSGLLFVGHSENFTDAKDLFRLQGKTVYERV